MDFTQSDEGDLLKEHKYLKPVFKTRNQFLLFDAITYTNYVIIAEITEMKIKQVSILGNCGIKLTKIFLSHLAGM